MKPLKKMLGLKIGKWTIIKRGPNTKQGQAQWLCQCSCGSFKIVRGYHLRNGSSTKCKDCHNYFFARKHGKYNSKVYAVLESMIARCHNPKSAAFKNYGARGIYVCDEWKDSFINFWSDMGDRPNELTLDRIDNNGPYCKQNCRWTSRLEQSKNTRISHKVGNVYRCWKLIEKPDYSKKSTFECIYCRRKWISETNYVTSNRCAICNCKTTH